MQCQIEGPQLLQYGFRDAIAKVGLYKFLSDLLWIGMFYHLYNQVHHEYVMYQHISFFFNRVGNSLSLLTFADSY